MIFGVSLGGDGIGDGDPAFIQSVRKVTLGGERVGLGFLLPFW